MFSFPGDDCFATLAAAASTGAARSTPVCFLTRLYIHEVNSGVNTAVTITEAATWTIAIGAITF
jgi:hypothetical protein